VSPSLEASGGIQEGRTREIETEGGRVKVDDDGGEVDNDGLEEEDDNSVLHFGDDAVAHSEAGVEAAVCSEVRKEEATCSGRRAHSSASRHDLKARHGLYGCISFHLASSNTV
jgi:hypothetical protein